MTSDEVEMSISVENAKQMTTIKNMMDDIGADIVAPLPNVDHETMVKIEAYILHHANDPPESEKKEDTKQTDEIVPWDRDFIAVSQTTLFKLTLAANYLESRNYWTYVVKLSPVNYEERLPRRYERCSILRMTLLQKRKLL